MAGNVALHNNVIEIYQKVNGGISFYLTAQENGMRRRTMSHNFVYSICHCMSKDVTQFICNFYPCTSHRHSRVVLYSTAQLDNTLHQLYCLRKVREAKKEKE
jgi:hypothetical protein